MEYITISEDVIEMLVPGELARARKYADDWGMCEFFVAGWIEAALKQLARNRRQGETA